MEGQLAGEAKARRAAEEEASALKAQLEKALGACGTARDECVRVRRRNEQVERELKALKERMAAALGGGQGGGVGLDEVCRSAPIISGLRHAPAAPYLDTVSWRGLGTCAGIREPRRDGHHCGREAHAACES